MMNKKILVMVSLLLVGALLIVGCTTTGDYSYDYSERQQQAPVGGGCGVASPLSEEPSVSVAVAEPTF